MLKNPFKSRPAPGSLEDYVKRATDDMLGDSSNHADWSINMEIVDKVNSSSASNPQFAPEKMAKYLVRRLGKSRHNTVMLTLYLCEALIKNSPKFRRAADLPIFVQAVYKIVLKGRGAGCNNMDVQQSEKALIFIKQWGEARVNQSFVKLYQRLCAEGVRFPAPLKDEVAPVTTPRGVGSSTRGGANRFFSNGTSTTNLSSAPGSKGGDNNSTSAQHASLSSSTGVPTAFSSSQQQAGGLTTKASPATQYASQYKGDMAELYNTLSLLKAMIASSKTVEDVTNGEDLVNSCKALAPYLQQAVHRSSDSQLASFLALNDELNHVLESYERALTGKTLNDNHSTDVSEKNDRIITAAVDASNHASYHHSTPATNTVAISINDSNDKKKQGNTSVSDNQVD